MGEDLVGFLYRMAEGRAREILEGIGAIERFARRNSGQEITCKLMAGQTLFNDRRTGAAVKVRG